ncbi:MAG: tetratricopeptide repeat protein [Candidatus Scalindua sp.]|nr:tetratricopeptide repeat protein [Candidatus Scalindua sp.]
MKNFYGVTRYRIFYLAILVLLTYGCGNDEPVTESTVFDEIVQEEEKVAVVEKLPDLGNTDAEAYYNFGIDTIKKGNFDLALEAWNKAIEIDPAMIKAHNYLGRAYYTRGMMEEAIAAYKKVLELAPEDPSGYINLGIAYRYNEMYDESLEVLQKAIEINPISAIAYDEIGSALLKKEKYDEAIGAYKNAVAIDPKYPQPHNNLGVVYLLKGMSKDASAEFELFKQLSAEKKAEQAKIMGGGH